MFALGWVEKTVGALECQEILPRYAPKGSFRVRESDIFSVTVYLESEQVTQQVSPEENQEDLPQS
jgi:hypothetical protein